MANVMPVYGPFININVPEVLNFINQQFFGASYVSSEARKALFDWARDNKEQVVLVPLHDPKGQNPFFLRDGKPDSSGVRHCLKIWCVKGQMHNPEQMVVIQETVREVGGFTVSVPHKMVVGSQLNMVAHVNIREEDCHDCENAPLSSIPVIQTQEGVEATVKNPLNMHVVAGGQYPLFVGGVRSSLPQQSARTLHYAAHVYYTARNQEVPGHNCHGLDEAIDLGGPDLLSASPR